MKQEIRNHLFPLLLIFVFVSIFWFVGKVPYFEIIYLFLGLLIGAFFLDFDHLIYWFYLKPNIEESRLAQQAFKNNDYKSVFILFKATHKNHSSLIFHHYFFQIVLALISLFAFTSSNQTFALAFLVALNCHLLVDETNDFFVDKKSLQNWLFAREDKQLSIEYLKYYLLIFGLLLFTFTILLLKSKP